MSIDGFVIVDVVVLNKQVSAGFRLEKYSKDALQILQPIIWPGRKVPLIDLYTGIVTNA